MKATIGANDWGHEWEWFVRYEGVYFVSVRPDSSQFQTERGAKRNARRWLQKHMPHVEIEEES